jgi:hypothetical protein
LKTRRSFSNTLNTHNSCFRLCCCSLHNEKCIIGDYDVVTWLDLTFYPLDRSKWQVPTTEFPFDSIRRRRMYK